MSMHKQIGLPVEALRKLKEVDPGSPEWIVHRFEAICEEQSRQQWILDKEVLRRVLMTPLRLLTGEGPDGFLKDVWDRTDNNLRKAIVDYCTAFPDHARAARLSDDDLQTLAVPQGHALYHNISKPQGLNL